MADIVPFSASEMEGLSKLTDKLANDKEFARGVAAHKPGEEMKLKQFLAGQGFKADEVSIDRAAPTQHCFEICLCSTIIKGLCVCVRYCTQTAI